MPNPRGFGRYGRCSWPHLVITGQHGRSRRPAGWASVPYATTGALSAMPRRFCAAPAALADGWGDPLRWLTEAEAGFDRRDLPRLAERCRELLKESQPN